jgi:G3E family GTPase
MRVVDYTNERTRAIPLTAIDGHQGAGKSAIVRHVMRAAHGRITAVVRSLDQLVADDPDVRRSGPVALWPNGSMSVETDDPTATLALLARREEPPDHVLVEGDGTANTRRLDGYGYMRGYRPDGLITVVDASTATRRDRGDRVATEFSANLLHADLIVLNKADLAGREATAAAQRLLASLAPQACFVWCTGGRIAVPLLLGPALRTPQDRTVTTTWDPDCRAMRDSRPPDLIGEHCRSWSIFSDEPIAGKEFRRWVSRLPPFILRAAGSVFLREERQHRYEFSYIGKRSILSRSLPWAAEAPSTRLTIVGTDGSRGESARLIRQAPAHILADSTGPAQ